MQGRGLVLKLHTSFCTQPYSIHPQLHTYSLHTALFTNLWHKLYIHSQQMLNWMLSILHRVQTAICKIVLYDWITFPIAFNLEIEWAFFQVVLENPAYGRHQISWPMRLVAPHNLIFYLHLHLHLHLHNLLPGWPCQRSAAWLILPQFEGQWEASEKLCGKGSSATSGHRDC